MSTPEPELLSPTQGSSGSSVWDTMSELMSPEPELDAERTASTAVLPGPSPQPGPSNQPEPSNQPGPSSVTSRIVVSPMTTQNKRKRKLPTKQVPDPLDQALESLKVYYSTKAMNIGESASRSFAQTVEQMLEGIRNSKRRRRVKAEFMRILAETRSDSEDSS